MCMKQDTLPAEACGLQKKNGDRNRAKHQTQTSGTKFQERRISDELRDLLLRKQQLELDMEQQTGSKQEKEYLKAVYCHPVYLTSMQSTS